MACRAQALQLRIRSAGPDSHCDCNSFWDIFEILNMDSVITFAIGAVITLFFVVNYLRNLKKRDARAKEAAENGKLFSEGPKSQHPHIDTNYCIGCANVYRVCPEGDVLAMIAGKAAMVNGHKCIGHGLCAEACPVGAITWSWPVPAWAPTCRH